MSAAPRLVALLTATMMAGEIVAGWLTNSMALLADGWHMGTHVAALSVTAFAYWYARRHAAHPRTRILARRRPPRPDL